MPIASMVSRTDIQAAIDRTTANPDVLDIIHISHPSWPYPSSSGSNSSETPDRPHIVIFDSSFNPPHFAHYGMAASSLPPAISPVHTHNGTSGESAVDDPYTARLLLFSVRNIEKTPKPGDASTIQRIEMTLLLAQYLTQKASLPGGIAVGLINEPTFVRKSRIIHNYFSSTTSSHSTHSQNPRLSFVIGTDTLARFFIPKHYPQGMDSAMSQYFKEDESILICTRRGTGQENRQVEDRILAEEAVQPWLGMGGVRMLGSGQEGWEEVSSTKIREKVKEGDWEGLGGLVPGQIGEYIKGEGLYTT